MWDARYAVDEYVYGMTPNAFLAEHAGLLSGPVLSVAEGEGRNAAYLASLGRAHILLARARAPNSLTWTGDGTVSAKMR